MKGSEVINKTKGKQVKEWYSKLGITQVRISGKSELMQASRAGNKRKLFKKKSIDGVKKNQREIDNNVNISSKNNDLNNVHSKKYLLFTPGPVNVSANVRMAICKEDICHREEDFDFLLQSIEKKLLQLCKINSVKDYRAVVITGSGTAANEAILSSVVDKKTILILSNGEFGKRLFDLSEIHNPNTFLLKFPWGAKYDLDKIESYLKKNKVDIIAMVHHETSSGMLNQLEEMGSLSKKYNTMLLVDCVSSIGAEMIDLEKCNISFCSSSSSKAIASYAGISFVIGKTSEFEKLKEIPSKITYLNLYKFYNFIKTISQTPNTPAIHLFYALEQAITNILDEGITRRRQNLSNRANILRTGMKNMGLSFLINEKDMCSMLTTVNIPEYISVSELRQKLREKNIIIYEGKGELKNKVFQVGNIGELSSTEIQFFLDSLQEILKIAQDKHVK